jgi:tRNA-2-methylthio-N6-dimethylallyladenosine synthase
MSSENGHKRFELMADDVGAYGIDIQSTLPELLDALFAVPGDYRMAIWNLSPLWLVKYHRDLIPILQQNKISHLHCPVQSGSSQVLQAMNRYSNMQKIRQAMALPSTYAPDVLITTDIIVGYPGETENDIDQTVELLCDLEFDTVGIFMYYDAPNTVASRSQEKIPPQVAKQRIRKVGSALDKRGIAYGVR